MKEIKCIDTDFEGGWNVLDYVINVGIQVFLEGVSIKMEVGENTPGLA